MKHYILPTLQPLSAGQLPFKIRVFHFVQMFCHCKINAIGISVFSAHYLNAHCLITSVNYLQYLKLSCSAPISGTKFSTRQSYIWLHVTKNLDLLRHIEYFLSGEMLKGRQFMVGMWLSQSHQGCRILHGLRFISPKIQLLLTQSKRAMAALALTAMFQGAG